MNNGTCTLENLCQRLKRANLKECHELAKVVMKAHSDIHNGPYMDSHSILQLLMHCDAIRDLPGFQEILNVCLCDHLGRKGFENSPYPQLMFWQKALNTVLSVNAGKIASQCPDKTQIAQNIFNNRFEALQTMLQAEKYESINENCPGLYCYHYYALFICSLHAATVYISCHENIDIDHLKTALMLKNLDVINTPDHAQFGSVLKCQQQNTDYKSYYIRFSVFCLGAGYGHGVNRHSGNYYGGGISFDPFWNDDQISTTEQTTLTLRIKDNQGRSIWRDENPILATK